MQLLLPRINIVKILSDLCIRGDVNLITKLYNIAGFSN
jgi:hypothetical protein